MATSDERAPGRWWLAHEAAGQGGRGRWTWLLEVDGGWLVLVRVTDETTWGGLTFVPDAAHECPPVPPRS